MPKKWWRSGAVCVYVSGRDHPKQSGPPNGQEKLETELD